ncbi:hypothetical protein ACJZ2D_011122 [Fusarium nematophilum]
MTLFAAVNESRGKAGSSNEWPVEASDTRQAFLIAAQVFSSASPHPRSDAKPGEVHAAASAKLSELSSFGHDPPSGQHCGPLGGLPGGPPLSQRAEWDVPGR